MAFGGHVTSSVTWPFDSPYVSSYWWSFGTNPVSLTVSEIFNVECNAVVDMTSMRPLNKGQGHSFWYQSDFSYTTSYRLSIVTFALGCTVWPQYIPYRRRQTQACRISATALSTVGWKLFSEVLCSLEKWPAIVLYVCWSTERPADMPAPSSFTN